MIILGCDPGFANFGWCLAHYHGGDTLAIDSLGVIETRPHGKRNTQSESNARRASKIGVNLDKLAKTADVMCVEAMSYPRNAMAAHKMGLAWGAMAVVCEDNELPLLQATPQDVKVAVCGKRSASKQDVETALCAIYPEAKSHTDRWPMGKREHMFDALGAIHALLDSDVIRMGVRK